MVDNRLAMMRVNRSGKTSRSEHGNEAVPTRSERTRAAPAQGYAHVDARGGASRGGANAGSQSADNIELGQKAGRGSAGVAAQAVGTAQRPGHGAEEATGQSVTGRCGDERLSERTVDP